MSDPWAAAVTPERILDLPLDVNESGATTVRGYLAELLLTLWREGEGFSGKRPFSNSGWEDDLIIPLVSAGLVRGELGPFREWVDVDEDAARGLIEAAIKRLGVSPEGGDR